MFPPFVTYNINGNNVIIDWKRHPKFNCYYHEELVFANETVRQHTIRLISSVEQIYNKKIHYLLSKKVVLERADPDAIGFIY